MSTQPTKATYEKDGYKIAVDFSTRRAQQSPFEFLPKCPKCGAPSWTPVLAIRTGKNPEHAYAYWVFRHRRDGRTGRNKSCYVPASGPKTPHRSDIMPRFPYTPGVSTYVKGVDPVPSLE